MPKRACWEELKSYPRKVSTIYKKQDYVLSHYDDVRHNLIDLLEDLEDRLSHISDDVRHADKPLEKDFSEQAIETENDQVLDAIGNSTREEIKQIKQAISSIDNGTYGICRQCGQPIKKERLDVLPFSNLCICCASKKQQ